LLASHWTEDIHDPNDWLVPNAVGPVAKGLGVPADLLMKFRDQINQGAEAGDPAQRAAIYEQFNHDYHDAALQIITAVPNQSVFERRWVQGYYYNPDYLLYFYALAKQ
jgi:peptide/nickel transport system substrate-binding protein